MNDTTPDIPLSLYIHFPWCIRKCPYCDFNSHESKGDIPFAEYIDTLIRDLDKELSTERRGGLVSIFMGGGTPSLFPDAEINRLLRLISDRIDISESEITLEANPGTFDQSHFDGYRQAGVNRISIGAQSFSPAALDKLGRIHAPEETERAFEGARAAGFERINLDLMHGLPGQNLEEAMQDLDRAIRLGPEHVSWYQLTIEPNTVFYKRPPELPVEDILAEITTAGQRQLEAGGFTQYETSAYCRSGEQALHNLNYWQFGDYLGIGAGAHGKVTRGRNIIRSSKTRIPADYLREPTANESVVAQEELALEFLMDALRLTDGFDFALFERRTGLARQSLESFQEKALSRSLIELTADSIVPTERGRMFLNELLLLAD
ncbi:MAG: radical SAM family heme chaperone HemW [Pseudomonadales bacterium]|nr:radical SAM family heme chaperone HemW [Pseudomonadales bacterium]